MNTPEVGQRYSFRMWDSGAYVTGHVAEVWENRAGDTRVMFKRDGYRETYDVPADRFVDWSHAHT